MFCQTPEIGLKLQQQPTSRYQRIKANQAGHKQPGWGAVWAKVFIINHILLSRI